LSHFIFNNQLASSARGILKYFLRHFKKVVVLPKNPHPHRQKKISRRKHSASSRLKEDNRQFTYDEN